MVTNRPQGAVPLWPVAVLVLAMACFQSGGPLSKTLFPLVGASGAAALRLTVSAMLLLALVRPWRGGRLTRSGLGRVLLYGLGMAGLNGFFFLALQTIPVGVAVAIDFLGPLGVAVAHSRRPVDVLWAMLAMAGIVTLLPLGPDAVALDPIGLAYCFCAAGCWAFYILAGRAAGAELSANRATALGMTVAALVLLPFGIARAGAALLSPAVLPTAALVAVLSSALPYTLEMMALTRLPPRLFGVLMSLEPAMGASFAWIILGERLTLREAAAILLVILASAGATFTAGESRGKGTIA